MVISRPDALPPDILSALKVNVSPHPVPAATRKKTKIILTV
jgi:hypothetical protein